MPTCLQHENNSRGERVSIVAIETNLADDYNSDAGYASPMSTDPFDLTYMQDNNTEVELKDALPTAPPINAVIHRCESSIVSLLYTCISTHSCLHCNT